MITLEQGVELVWRAFTEMVGGEIFVRKIPMESSISRMLLRLRQDMRSRALGPARNSTNK